VEAPQKATMEGSDVRMTIVGAERDLLAQERRRIAADVHDLVMQDLALALASARALADAGVVRQASVAQQAGIVVAAGERALAGARQLLDDLSARERRPVIEAVEDSVRTAARTTPLSFDASRVPAGAEPDQATLDALVHIGREAVTNATKHADPTAIEVLLEREDEWRLQIRDDGRGYDAVHVPAIGASHSRGGFGLENMRRCAHALGGSLLLISAPQGGGTTVEAVLP
jgi:signal transduction histidine kinase